MARLNVQGLARKDALVSYIKPESGSIVVSLDLAAGEPTVTGEFSRDHNYLYSTFEGVGKVPFYRNGVLMIDDIYLMTMSVSPIGAATIKRAFCEQHFDGTPFAETWMNDPEKIKKFFKKERDLHKMLCLALGYGMGPKKMMKQTYDKGHHMELSVARDFYRAYWDLFRGVKRFADRLALQIKQKGFIINPFGYRLTPPPFKAFNYFIQSSVSGIMHVFNAKLFAAAPYARFITVIHDEVLAEVPLDRLDDFRKAKEQATQSLNDDLKWTVAVRTGFAPGLNWFTAK